MKSFVIGMVGAALFAVLIARAVDRWAPCSPGYWEGVRLFYSVSCKR